MTNLTGLYNAFYKSSDAYLRFNFIVIFVLCIVVIYMCIFMYSFALVKRSKSQAYPLGENLGGNNPFPILYIN